MAVGLWEFSSSVDHHRVIMALFICNPKGVLQSQGGGGAQDESCGKN